jgi:hypothetical protein
VSGQTVTWNNGLDFTITPIGAGPAGTISSNAPDPLADKKAIRKMFLQSSHSETIHMADNRADQPKQPRNWLAWLTIFGFLAGTCIGTIANDVADTHGRAIWGAAIGLGLGFVVGLLVRSIQRREQPERTTNN